MRELIQLTDTELDLVSGGAGAAAAGAGTTSASAGSAENLGVNFLIVDGLIITALWCPRRRDKTARRQGARKPD